ncbi:MULTISPECIES: hypothetical protein [unclassified Spirosoma]|uniref:hypothetical protein n=1 Tax=unclassified Spirosoma TaxID=2621999 RepID=UPI000962480E|nr:MULTISPECIES: hypothetical protein [unclassified Spirosoma]MBN8823840.1 hypothetical protein [Spirosoma sp.]OJW79767.1 MAG: hypothetical protein BGO59_00500 [Spirosoma sp. 48-14]
MSDTRNYRLVYPDSRTNEIEPSGGYVEVHRTHNSEEAERNIETAILLAKLGYQVRLLLIDNTPHVKNPDAFLVKEQITIEFKHNQQPTTSAIEKEIRYAHRQADYVLIHIQSNIRRNDLIKAIKNRLKLSIGVRELWIIWKGELIRLKRKDVFDGTISHKIQ